MDTARLQHDTFEPAGFDEPLDRPPQVLQRGECKTPLPAPFAEVALMKQAMRRLAGGVVVVTAGTGEERVGFTATTAVSLSVDPPTMLICVNRASSSLPVIRQRRHFCVNVLGSEHQAVAERFAGFGCAGNAIRGTARYHGADWVAMYSGAQGLVGAQAIVDCELDEAIDRHSHCILLGAVREVRLAHEASASLVYRTGQFASVPLPS